jgi:hypothetical protein
MKLRRGKRNPKNKIKKARYLDHIDLRVNNLKRAYKFYSKLLPALGFVSDRSSGPWGIFYVVGGDKPDAFFGFIQNQSHQANGTRIAFWADSRTEGLPGWRAKLARKNWKVRSSVTTTIVVITLAFSRIPMATNWKSAFAKIQLFRISKSTLPE